MRSSTKDMLAGFLLIGIMVLILGGILYFLHYTHREAETCHHSICPIGSVPEYGDNGCLCVVRPY